jgi:hypothetical protein
MTSSEVKSSQPTWQDIEKALIVVVRAGFYYKKPKDGKFLQSYKKRIDELRKADDPSEFVIEKAQYLFPNEAKYNQMKKDYRTYYKYEPRTLKALESLNEIYYTIAKEYFQTDEDIEKEADDFLNDGNADDAEEFIND